MNACLATVRMVALLAGLGVLLLPSFGTDEFNARTKRSQPQGPVRFDEAAEAQAYYLQKRLPPGEKELPVDRYLKAVRDAAELPTYSTVLNRFITVPDKQSSVGAQSALLSTWRALGPGNIGGRTRSLLINPSNPNVMYAGAVAGGVWKTTNGGVSWAPVSDLLPNIAISSMAMSPSNPEIIYAGTGEHFANPDGVRGAGIFLTTDGGSSWTQLAATLNQDFYFVNDIVISPASVNRVYAATSTGVFRSTDAGTNWSRVLDPPAAANLEGFSDLAIRTDLTTDYVFASSGLLAGLTTIYLNTDAGGSGVWVPVLAEPGMNRASLAIAPSNQNIVYALVWGRVGNNPCLYGVFRSTQGGAMGTWTAQVRGNDPIKLNTVLLCNPFYAFGSECFGQRDVLFTQGAYDNTIAVDPVDPDRVWAGGIDLFRSDDGGKNWGLASYWWIDSTRAQYVHADQHAIVFHPNYNGASNQTMFVTNDGGIFRTDIARGITATGARAPCDASQGGISWTSIDNNYQATQFYHGIPFPDGQHYIGGTQDNGVVLGSDSAGINNWTQSYGGDAGFVAVDPTSPALLYATNNITLVIRSISGGASWSQAASGITDAFNFVPPLVIDPSTPQRLWTGGGFIWRSDNSATSWVRASSGLAEAFSASALAIAAANPNRMLVGTGGGHVHRIDNALAATATTEWAFTLLRPSYVSSLAFDPSNADVAYATLSTFKTAPAESYVYKSTDAGATWTGIDGQGTNKLPDVPAQSIVVDPNDSSRLYVGTDLGVFVSIDGGANWARENTGFSNAPTECLALNTLSGVTTLFAFTHGRGAWKVTLSASCASISPTTQSFGSEGGTSTAVVTATQNCDWLALSNAGWIRITSSGSGVGGGTVGYSVGINSDSMPRVGTITIAGRTLTINQAANDNGPRINSVEAGKKNLFVSGMNFDSGSVILLDAVQRKTVHDDQDPNLLIGKKLALEIAQGQTVIVQVRNSTGALSPEFSFTRQ